MDAETETLIPTNGGYFSYALAGNTIGRKPENGGNGLGYDQETMYTLTKTDLHAVAQPVGAFFAGQGAKAGSIAYSDHISPTLKASDSGTNRTPSVHISMQVRRLTPVECERLQGFPDGYTDIKPNGKATPDGPRYKALGNSWAVPCVRWIGKRIAEHLNANP